MCKEILKTVDVDDLSMVSALVKATKVVLDDLHNDYFAHGYIGSAVGFTKAKSRVDAMTFLLEELEKELNDNGIHVD